MKAIQRDIFLSHSSRNKPKVRALRADIESVGVNGGNLTAWIDEAEIKTGSIPAHINAGLETSRFIAFCLTPDYFNSSSGWTDAEWHSALHIDPDNRTGRLLPILLEDTPYIPVLMRHLRMIDMRGNAYRSGLRELVDILKGNSLAAPLTVRGQVVAPDQRISRSTLVAERASIQGLPDVVSETLHCNLLPVEKLPSTIYSAPLQLNLLRPRKDGSRAYPTKEDIKAIIRETQTLAGVDTPRTPAFRVIDGRIITFHDLDSSETLFTNIIQESRICRDSLTDYITEEDNRNIVVSLLTMALDRHAYAAGLVRDPDRRKKSRYYFPPRDGGENIINWKPWKKQTTRTVAKPCFKDGNLQFWRHQAAYMAFQFVANRFYIKIEPTWVITKDGEEIERGPTVGRLIVRWTGPERNLSLLYHIRFWSSVLKRRPGPILIRAGDQYVEVSSTPAFVEQQVGIAHDYKNLLAELDRRSTIISRNEEERVEFAVEVAQRITEDEIEDEALDSGDDSDEAGPLQE